MEIGDCLWNICEACEVAKLPHDEQLVTARAVQKVVESQKRICGEAGKLSTESLTRLSRQVVGGLDNPTTSTLVLGAMTLRNRGDCVLPD